MNIKVKNNIPVIILQKFQLGILVDINKTAKIIRTVLFFCFFKAGWYQFWSTSRTNALTLMWIVQKQEVIGHHEPEMAYLPPLKIQVK